MSKKVKGKRKRNQFIGILARAFRKRHGKKRIKATAGSIKDIDAMIKEMWTYQQPTCNGCGKNVFMEKTCFDCGVKEFVNRVYPDGTTPLVMVASPIDTEGVNPPEGMNKVVSPYMQPGHVMIVPLHQWEEMSKEMYLER